MKISIFKKISKGSIYLLVFLLPLFFLPWTLNFLDFNKQALLIVLVFISLFLWLLEILISGKFTFHLNWLHLLVVAFFLVYLLSTIFSFWPYGSFWGWPQITSESLLTLLSLVLLYFLVINIFEKRELPYLIALLLFSSFFTMFFGVLQLLGISSFYKLGGINNLAIVGAVLLPLAVFLIMINTKIFWRGLFIATAILGTFFLILVNFPISWWLVLIGFVLIITLTVQKRELFDNRWLILPIFFLGLALFCLLFKFQLPGVPLRPLELFLTQKASFNIVREALKENPVFGSGPGTFVYDFSKYKALGFNQSQVWNLRFEWASSKILSLLATTGILGLLSFFALIGFFLFFGIKSLFWPAISFAKDDEGFLGKWSFGIFISFITLSLSYFFYFSNLTLDFTFFLLMASLLLLLAPTKKEILLKRSSLANLLLTFIFILVFIFGLGIFILEGKRLISQVTYLKGMKLWQEGQRIDSLALLSRAVRLEPKSDFYWRELSQAYLKNMEQLPQRTDLPREDIALQAQSLIEKAVNSAQRASDLNPKNVANWSVRGFIYQSLIGIVAGTKDWAVKSYEEALKLEPTNPYFPTQIGISLLREVSFLPQERMTEREKILAEAQEQFKKAIELKSDYSPAHFQLGLVYYQNKDFQKAREELEKVALLNPDNLEVKKILENLKAGKALDNDF